MLSSAAIKFAGVVLIVLHLAVLFRAGASASGSLSSNIIQLAASLLAVASCYLASKRLKGFASHFWFLMGTSFLLWSLAQTGWTYYEDYLHQVVPTISPVNILFFFYFAPMGVALLLPPDFRNKQAFWPFVLDLTQLFIVLITAYLSFFYMPSYWYGREAELNAAIRASSEVRNYVLLGAFLFRIGISPSRRVARLFEKMFAVLVIYSLGETLLFHMAPAAVINTGKWFDLTWTLAFVLAAVLVTDTEEVPEPTGTNRRANTFRAILAVYFLPIFIPVFVLLLASRILVEQLFLAAVSVAASFLCAGCRVIIASVSRERAVSELRDTEAELRKSQQKLALHVQQTPLAVIEWDLASRVMDWNPAAERIFGYSKEEAIGQHASFILPESVRPQVDQVCGDLLHDRGGTRSTNRNLTKSGKLVTCEWYNTSLVDGSRQVLGVASLVQDVTEQRNLENQLRQSQKMEAVGTLAGGIAHDFNNLLTVITGYSYMLQDRFKQDAGVPDLLQEVIDAAQRAAALTNQLLTFSRKQVIQPVALNLNDSVKQMERMLRRVIGEDVSLQTVLPNDLFKIKADVGQIEQVIMNVAVNARDAMPNGGTLRFETSNTTSAHPQFKAGSIPGSFALLTVSDTGCGMDSDTIEHIFEPFFTTKKGSGTGLGLSTVFGIIQAAGGYISVESTVGKGTSFHFFFPSFADADASTRRSQSRIAQGGTETILLVEDERSVRDLAAAILMDYGYTVLSARSGVEAEEMSFEFAQPIDLLMTDVVMPGMSGPEVAQRLCEKRPGLRVLYTSGYTDNALTRSALDSHPQRFLQKPFAPEGLARKVREVLDRNS